MTGTVEFSPSGAPIDARFFYVSARKEWQGGYRYALVAGPYSSHAEALAAEPAVRRLAERADPRAVWYAFGTAGSAEPIQTPLGVVVP